MLLRDIFRAPKTNVKISKWESGKVPKRQFPMSKLKNGVQMGPDWSWRVVLFSAIGNDFRLLIKLNEKKEYFAAILAIEYNSDLLVLCHHELHTSHKGWHCHYINGNVMDTYPGVWRDRQRMVSWPSFSVSACQVQFNITQANALSIAASRFKFQAQGSLV